MIRRIPGREAVTTILLLVAGLAACDEASDSAIGPTFSVDPGWERTSFEVYSQNLYLGGNTGALFDPATLADPLALLTAVNVFWGEVLQSDVAARMDVIAEEIARRGPEVVGVQEALQFATLGPTFQPDGAAVVDLLGALQTAIAAKGLPYELAVVRSGTSSALPLSVDQSTGAVTQYLGFTDRVAILKRSDVVVTDADSAKYFYSVPVAPGVSIERGWARVTVDHEGEAHHFVTTHLESQRVRPVNEAQGAELLAMLAGLGDGVTVVAGDFNSDAAASDGAPSYTDTYSNFIAAGFADLWELAPHSQTDPGFTCCQADDLRNATSTLDERIDFILVRSSDGPIPGDDARRGHFRLDLVGVRPSDRTADGLWPSDHAGLAGSIRNPEHAIAD